MRKLLFLFSLSILFLYGKPQQYVQIIANTIDTKDSIVKANGNVLIFMPKYYITANKIIFDQNRSTLELFGNVNISKNNQLSTLTNHAFLDLKNDINKATPILLIDKTTHVWINAAVVEKKDDLHILKDATISSCECYKPAWSISFSSGDYNTSSKWVNTYFDTVYIKDMPLWYVLIPAYPYLSTPNLILSYLIAKPPYFGFSTNKQRRSGLLKPTLGYSRDDGYFYMQPIYWAPRKDLDFEYIPQFRTERGYGHELKFRYKDSPYSLLKINTGIFKEKENYFEEHNLENDTHYGWNLNYKRDKLFANNNSSHDGLQISLQDMNDVEYFNTRYKQTTTTTNRLLESKIQYYYNTNSYYGDIQTQYFNDISKPNNDDVMQIIPKVQLHKYSTSFLFDKLTTSVDVKYDRKTRKTGIGADTTNILVPFTYNQYLFNKFLGISFTEQFNFTNIQYDNNDSFDNAYYLQNKHIVSLDVDLLKAYETKIHTINFNITASKPHKIKYKGDIYKITNDSSTLSLFPITQSEKTLNFTINQSIYDSSSLSTIINHKIKQSIVYDHNNSSELTNLENEITLFFPNGSISNRSIYNHKDNVIINSTYAFKYKKDNFKLNIDYSYSKDKTDAPADFSYKDLPDLKSITGYISNKVLKYYTISYKEQYDITHEISNIKEYKISIDKKCWKFDLKLADNLVATATTTNKARRQNIIYATITLKPIISYTQMYIDKEREE